MASSVCVIDHFPNWEESQLQAKKEKKREKAAIHFSLILALLCETNTHVQEYTLHTHAEAPAKCAQRHSYTIVLSYLERLVIQILSEGLILSSPGHS